MSFDCQPNLSSDLLELRALGQGDFAGLYEVAVDPLLWEQTPYKDRYEKPVYKAWFDKAVENKALIVIEKETGLIIGSSRFYGVDVDKAEVIIGYTFLARNKWGGVINNDLKQLMLNHAFKTFEVVWLEIAQNNARSRKAALKIGAELSHEGEKKGLNYCFYKLLKK